MNVVEEKMMKETGYTADGESLKSDRPICTKTGIIVYKGEGDNYYLKFPYKDNKERIYTNSKDVSDLFYYLNVYDGDLDKAYDAVWGRK